MTAPRIPTAGAAIRTPAAESTGVSAPPITPNAPGTVGALNDRNDPVVQQARDAAMDAGIAAGLSPVAGAMAKPAARFLHNTEVGRGLSAGVMALVDAVPKNVAGTARLSALPSVGVARAVNGLRAHFGLEPSTEASKFIDWYNDSASGVQAINPVPDALQREFEPRTWMGSLVKGVTQWGIGFALTRKLLPVTAGARMAATATTVVGQQALVNAGFFDAYQARISNFVQTTGLANPVAEWLQADPEDGFATAKLKQIAEGALLDSGMEFMTAMWAVRAQGLLKSGKTAEAARAADQMVAAATQAEARAATRPATVVMEGDQAAVEVRFPTDQPPVPRGSPEHVAQLEADLRGAQRAAETDALTGLGNQRAWLRAKPAAEADPNTAVITFDLNNFKPFNDAQGHSAGDALLRRLGQTIQSVTDRGFRSGTGDEFTVLAPKGQADQLRQTVEDLFGEHPFTNAEGTTFATSITGHIGDTFDAADAGLQAAKTARKAATGGTAPRIPAASRAEAEATASVLNHEAEVMARPRGIGALTPETVQTIRAAARAARGMSPEGTDDVFSKYLGNLNLSYLQTPEETNALFEGIFRTFREELGTARGATSIAESNARAVQLLDGVAVGDASSLVQQWAQQSGDAEARAQAARFFLGAQGRTVATLSAFADMHPDNALAYEQLAKAMDYLVTTQESLTAITASAGRTLRIFGEPVTGTELNVASGVVRAGDEAATTAARAAGAEAGATAEAAATRLYAGMTKRQIQSLARYIRFANGSPDIIRQILKVTQEMPKHAGDPTVMQQLVRWRMNFLLSGVKTHLTNLTSNTLVAFQLPAEYWWGGVRYGDQQAITKGTQTMFGLFTEAKDAWGAAKKALMTGNNILDAGSAVVDGQFAHAGPDEWMLKLLDAPTRFLMASDEFYKVLNYRAAVRARSVEQSLADGLTDPRLIAERISDDLAGAFTAGGQGIDPVALEYAKEATFTRRLTSPIGQLVEQAGQIPAVRIVAPFIRTPTNILKYAWERTPGLNLLSKEVRGDLAAGGIRANRRLAQVNMSNALIKMTAMGAISGQVTGAGPKNKQLRRQLMDAGWKPYSFKLADGSYVSYRRGDPLSSHIGLVADFVELTGGGPEEDTNEIAAAMVLATISAASSKTFMQGVVQFTDLLGTNATESEWHKFAGSLLSSTLIPSEVRQANGDTTLRETQGYLDNLRSAIAGQSENLEPHRNVFGEPVLQPPGYFNKTLNPFTYAPGSRVDGVQVQLVNLGKSLSMPGRWLGTGRTLDMADRTAWNTAWQALSGRTKAERTASGALPQSPFDRMMELMGSTTIEGKTLRETVTALVRSPEWGMVEEAPGDYPGGVRHARVQMILGAYAGVARTQVLNEFPLLRSAYARERTNAWLAKNTMNPRTAIADNQGLFAQVDSAVAGTGPQAPNAQVSAIVSSLLQQ